MLVKGPMLIKTDSGTGRQTNSTANIKFREDMRALGFYISLGLPNSAQVSQEIDELYENFKGMANTTT